MGGLSFRYQYHELVRIQSANGSCHNLFSINRPRRYRIRVDLTRLCLATRLAVNDVHHDSCVRHQCTVSVADYVVGIRQVWPSATTTETPRDWNQRSATRTRAPSRGFRPPNFCDGDSRSLPLRRRLCAGRYCRRVARLWYKCSLRLTSSSSLG